MLLTTQQKTVIENILSGIFSKIDDECNYMTVGGYAGTGKTTIIGELRKRLYELFPYLSVAFVTFTGKASSVLLNKLTMTNSYFGIDYCGTIHGLIYKPLFEWDNKLKRYIVVGWKKISNDEFYHKIIIIDEASMVSKEIWNDLKSYGVPIIAFGDHGQLPPIGDDFNLMKSPIFTLTEIHRQALNSPIIKLSQVARKEGYIPFGIYSKEVFKISWRHPKCLDIWKNVSYVDPNLSILCGFNITRNNINHMIRDSLGYKERAPYPGEKIVCLCNNHNLRIMNGQIGNVIWLVPDDDSYRITVEIDNELYDCLVADQCFGESKYSLYDKSPKLMRLRDQCFDKGYTNVDFFDYGYVISVHKSQGSEWDKVILFEQRTSNWDDEYYAKWLYTAITRAKNKLMIITDAWV